MKKELLSLSAAVGFVAAASLPAIANGNNACPAQPRLPKWAKPGTTIERCAGIVKKGKNDCRANGHACAGRAREDNHAREFIWLPQGVCEKMTKGVVRSKVKVPGEYED